MNREQAFKMIEEAKVRLITEAEADELGEWSKAELAANPTQVPAGTDGQGQHVLIDFITQYTKGTRPTEHFGANFKLVNRTIMPQVVAVFSQKA